MIDHNEGITFATFNVNGASRYEKQKDIFDYIRKKHLDIIFLQETHVKSQSENYLRSLWGYNCFVCGNSNASKGVAILFKNTFSYKIHNVIKDEINGSFLILDLSIFDEKFTLANVYGPSDRDNPDFFVQLFEIIERVGNRQVMAAGDWNVLLDPTLDSRNHGSYISRPRSRRMIKEKMAHLDLIDIYRHVFPTKRAYTWRRFNSIQQSRLDYFLISDSLVDKILNVNILPGYRSDHSIVSTTLINPQIQKKNKSYWKFNSSLLKDKVYIDEIKKVISNTKQQYAVPVYNFDQIENIPNEDILFVINDQLFFETLLMEIRAKTISYSSYKKRKNDEIESKLEKEIEHLESDPQIDNTKMLQLEEKKITIARIKRK